MYRSPRCPSDGCGGDDGVLCAGCKAKRDSLRQLAIAQIEAKKQEEASRVVVAEGSKRKVDVPEDEIDGKIKVLKMSMTRHREAVDVQARVLSDLRNKRDRILQNLDDNMTEIRNCITLMEHHELRRDEATADLENAVHQKFVRP